MKNLTQGDVLGGGGACHRRKGRPCGGAAEVAARQASGRGRGPAPARRGHHARPCLEELEGRLVLSTNVTTALAGGSLTITVPDTASITLSEPAAGEITITPDSSATVNNMSSATITGVSRNLTIILKAGDDTVTFDQTSPISINGDLTVNEGPGNDTVQSSGGRPSLWAGT
jgi:hypothetical protein